MDETLQNVNKKIRFDSHDIKHDRLSSLPDTLLVEILDRVPIKSAVQTSVLSRRWTHLWTQITRVEYNCHKFVNGLFYQPRLKGSDFRKIFAAIDLVFRQLESPKMHSFSFFVRNIFKSEKPWKKLKCSAHFQSWIRQACQRSVEELQVSFDYCNLSPLVPIPNCLFECSSLVSLTLSGSFSCKLPDSGVIGINLPNLKKLVLVGVDLELNLLMNLFKSCPKLELLLLSLDLDVDDLVVCISSVNLKSLTVHLGGESERCRFVIDAPNLEHIAMRNCFAIYQFVSSPSTLQSADIGFWVTSFSSGYNRRSEISKLIRDISSVRSLQIKDNLAIFNPRCHVDVGVLNGFRNLTDISLKLKHSSWDKVCRNAPIPACLLSKLKQITVEGLVGDDNDVKLVEYIVSNADVLDKIHVAISFTNYDTDDSDCDKYDGEDGERNHLWNEYSFCQSLFTLSSKSATCVIELVGDYMQASSNGFHGGSLQCRLSYAF